MPAFKVIKDSAGDPAGLACPHCGVELAQMIEVDTAVRWNRADIEFEDGTLVLHYSVGESDFAHQSYLCEMCHKTATLPDGFDEINDSLDEQWD